MKQHNPNTELPPRAYQDEKFTSGYSIDILICFHTVIEEMQYIVGWYDYVEQEYRSQEDGCTFKVNALAWWYLPEYKAEKKEE